MKLISIFLVFIIACGYFYFAQAEEEISIVTYYPSPYGSYYELTWGCMNQSQSAARLVADEGGSIELGGYNCSTGGVGHPYIAFSNENDLIRDAYIELTKENELTIAVEDLPGSPGVVNIPSYKASLCVNYTMDIAAPFVPVKCPEDSYVVACGEGNCASQGQLRGTAPYSGGFPPPTTSCSASGYLICVKHADF